MPTYNAADYIETDTGNKVSRKSNICGAVNIILGGKTIIKPSAIIRGDLRRAGPQQAIAVSIGKYCMIGEGCVVRPAYKTYKGTFSYYPIKISDHVSIGAGSVIEAAAIGNHVEIGKNVIIGRFVVIKDCVKIADNAVIAPNTVIPSFSHFAGSPAHHIEDLPEVTQDLVEAASKSYYQSFRPAAAG